VSWVTTNLKEAGGKYGGLRTETVYKAEQGLGDVARQTEALYCTGAEP
jgi:hypothetical protein